MNFDCQIFICLYFNRSICSVETVVKRVSGCGKLMTLMILETPFVTCLEMDFLETECSALENTPRKTQMLVGLSIPLIMLFLTLASMIVAFR